MSTHTLTRARDWTSALQPELHHLWLDARPSDADTTARHIRSSLQEYGFALVRGFDADGNTREAVSGTLGPVAQRLGTVVPQNYQGSMLEDIRDFSDTEAFDNRGYRSAGELSLHTDPPTLIVLYCLQPARSGGENQLVNMGAIHAAMQQQRSDLLPHLYRGCRYWVPSETTAGEGRASDWKRPVLMLRDGQVSCVYYRPYIELAAKAANEPLTSAQTEALDCFDTLASTPRFQIRFTLAAGEAVVLHNRAVMHARSDYEDWPDARMRRHLLRWWIDAPDIRPTSPEHCLGNYFGT